jgi:hypothetical protein
MPPHKFYRDRLLCGMPLWQLPSLQVDHARPPAGLGTLRSEPRQPAFRAKLSPFVHLSKDLHPSLLGIMNQEMPSQAKMSCRASGRQEMHFRRPSIFPTSSPYVPTCTNSRVDLSRMQGVAMHQMQQRNCLIVLRRLQFLAEPTLRLSDDSLAVAVTPKSYGRDQLTKTVQ